MPQELNPTPNRAMTAMAGAMALIVLLLIAQMWLLAATLESYLEGHRAGVLPATIISLAIFLACFGLYAFVEHVDSASMK